MIQLILDFKVILAHLRYNDFMFPVPDKWRVISLALVVTLLAACSPGKPAPVKNDPTAPAGTLPVAPAATRTPPPPAGTPTPSLTPTITPTPGMGSTRFSFIDGMVQVYVPAGNFLMGSTDYDIWSITGSCRDCQREQFVDETPRITVYLDGFWIDSTEVTNEMFSSFVMASGYVTEAEKTGGGYNVNERNLAVTLIQGANWQHPRGADTSLSGLTDHPVVQVSWNDASAYCAWAGRQLPSEAQWEKAARGEHGSLYPWGEAGPNGGLANLADISLGPGVRDRSVMDEFAYTSPVGHYPAGASLYGAYDMSGNVAEWVNDLYGSTYYSLGNLRNPTGPSTGSDRVLRGGSWSSTSIYLLSAFRTHQKPNYRASFIGFRCAQAP